MKKPGVQMEERDIGHFFFLALQFSTFFKSGVQQKLTQHYKAILLDPKEKKSGIILQYFMGWGEEEDERWARMKEGTGGFGLVWRLHWEVVKVSWAWQQGQKETVAATQVWDHGW